MSENYSTREGQAPDWMVRGLLRSASFAEQEPEKPMFGTGVTLAQLKAQVSGLLGRCGVDLTSQEVASATHWLASRIADAVTDRDTQETLSQKMQHYVDGYVTDKARQRKTGVSERSPIHEPGWFDANFTPPTDREAQRAADRAEKFRHGREVTYAEGAAIFEGLIAATNRIASLDAEFSSADDDAKLARTRFENLALRFAAVVAGGGSIRHSVKSENLPMHCPEVVWMGSTSPRWIARLEALSHELEEVVVASEAAHFPGQTNVPKTTQQQSPYARHDWENQEEYNRDKVDVKKTDDQYVGGNVSSGTEEMSQRSVGGDMGNPIYVP